ncbi:hypothetical protein EV122DRAFT_256848 [Schizophyllum commune]
MALGFIIPRMSLPVLRRDAWGNLKTSAAASMKQAASVFVDNIRGSSARRTLVTTVGPKTMLRMRLQFLYGKASPVADLLPMLLQQIWLAYRTLQNKSAEHVTNNRFHVKCFDNEMYLKMRGAFETISRHFADRAEPLILLSRIDGVTGKVIPDQPARPQGGQTKVASPAPTVSSSTKRKADELPTTAQPSVPKRSRSG